MTVSPPLASQPVKKVAMPITHNPPMAAPVKNMPMRAVSTNQTTVQALFTFVPQVSATIVWKF